MKKNFLKKLNESFDWVYIFLYAFIACISFFVILAVFFTDPTTNDRSESESSPLISTLNNTKFVEIRKVYFHPNKKYNVYVDDEKVGYITRNNPIFKGKTFKLRDLDGNVIRSEKENKRIFTLNRSATFFDLNGDETIKIKENKLKNVTDINPEFRFSISNSSGDILGYTKAYFLAILKKTHAIVDNKENNLYIIEKNRLFFPKSYMIEVIEKEYNSIDIMDATLYCVVNDSIISFKNNSNSKKAR